ncbi:hypothetical protein TB2_028662 [Malus domestica]|uniref:Uncharacterized protein n=1 Tax=Malus domestica TaxID=3750 RepID=A0A498K9L9_MALDO|nr:hypothetical protein DVH24_038340 [Malus domestica]
MIVILCFPRGHERHHAVGRNYDFGGVTRQPDCSCFVNEERDDLSSLREESCSSSAVRDNTIDSSLSKSTRNWSKKRHDKAYSGPGNHSNITSTEKIQNKSRHAVQPENYMAQQRCQIRQSSNHPTTQTLLSRKTAIGLLAKDICRLTIIQVAVLSIKSQAQTARLQALKFCLEILSVQVQSQKYI